MLAAKNPIHMEFLCNKFLKMYQINQPNQAGLTGTPFTSILYDNTLPILKMIVYSAFFTYAC